MKKNKIILAALLSTTMLAGGVSSVSAAVAGTKDTNGSIKFGLGDPNGSGEIEKPGEEEKIIEVPDQPEHQTKGLLRFNFVPSFNFGERAISSSTDRFNPLMQEYNYKETPNEKKYMHQFVQVEDIRGNKTATWKVLVKAGQFEKLDAAGKPVSGQGLPTTSIAFKEQRLFNSATDGYVNGIFGGEVNDTTFLKGFKTTANPSLTLTSSDAALFNAETSTTGSKSTIVLGEDYKPNTDYAATDENKGVELTTPAKDIKEVGATYQSKITWTLNDAK